MLNFNIPDGAGFNICNSLKHRAMVGFGSYQGRTNIGQPLQNISLQALGRHTKADESPSAVLKFNNSGRRIFNKKRHGGRSYNSM